MRRNLQADSLILNFNILIFSLEFSSGQVLHVEKTGLYKGLVMELTPSLTRDNSKYALLLAL